MSQVVCTTVIRSSGKKQRTHTPNPVDQLKLLVQLHHEDAKEDHGEDHLTDGQRGVASVHRHSIADDDDETDDLQGGKRRDKENN